MKLTKKIDVLNLPLNGLYDTPSIIFRHMSISNQFENLITNGSCCTGVLNIADFG